MAEKLQRYGDRRQKSGEILQTKALKILDKLATKINNIDPEEIKIRDLSGLLRATADMIEKGAAAEADALGIEQIMQAITDSKN